MIKKVQNNIKNVHKTSYFIFHFILTERKNDSLKNCLDNKAINS